MITETRRAWQSVGARRGVATAVFWVGLLVASHGFALEAQPSFLMDHGALRITSSALELVIEKGAVVHIRSLRSGEALTRGPAGTMLQDIPQGFSSVNDLYWFRRWWTEAPGRYGADEKYQSARRKPVAGAVCRLERLGASRARLVYENLERGEPGDKLTIDVRIEPGTGEILLAATAETTHSDKPPVTVDIPLVGLAGRSVILGSGAKYDRRAPRASDCTTRVANGLYSPNLAVIEGERSCVAVWAEAAGFEPANVYVAHRETDDALILNSTIPYGGLPSGRDPRVLKSVVWRIGAFPAWVDAARRYRVLLERRTGARRLWEHPCAWAKQIHAVDTNVPLPQQAGRYYEELAKRISPSKLLLFYWNGSRIVLFGDHRYQRSTRTKPAVIGALKQRGFRWMGYHPYALLMPPHVKAKRLKEIAARGDLPEGYTFRPDYGGPPEKFFDYFRSIATGYYKPMAEARLWVLHAATRKFRDYLVRNFGNYCRAHRMDGAYMDILGSNAGHHFPPEKKVMEGQDWRRGEAGALKELQTKLPHLAVMSEYQTEVTLSYAFYSWSGTGHVTRTSEVGTQLNHPLRTALWGSYTWTRADEIDAAEEALIGGLPPMRLAIDRQGKVLEDEWRTAVCRLFTEEELFNDLPDQWAPEALACYRGRGGKWFQFRRLPFGDGYVEVSDEGYNVRVARLRGQNKSPLDEPVRIQYWIAYRNGKPIGLNPERTYPILMEPPQPEGKLWITDLPDGAFVHAVRHNKGWSVVELGARDGSERRGRVTVRFHRKCLRVCDARQDMAGPFEPNQEVVVTTRIPGGLVFVWEEPEPADGRFRSEFLGATGRLHSHGVPDPLWCHNGRIRKTAAKLGGQTFPTISIGPGRHRGYAEQWFDLAPGAEPILKFDVGYPAPKDRKRKRRLRPLRWSVRVNGAEVWSERLEPANAWRPREVALARYAGRRVLLTLSAEELANRDVPPSHLDQPALFGRVRIDRNPIALDPLDGSALPRPRHVIFADSFERAELDRSWAVHLSPAHGHAGRIAVERGLLRFTGQHYKYAYLSRRLGEDNISVQARLQVFRTGCATGWNPGIGLWWGKGRYTFLTGGGHKGGDERLVIRGLGARRIALGKRLIRVRDDNRYDFWVKIALTPDKVRFYSCLDGKNWQQEGEVPRRKEYAGPPKMLIVGSGSAGPSELFSNDARWKTNTRNAYLDEILVGRD